MILQLIKSAQMPFKGNKVPRHILVNRVDAMGDVVLALPVCGMIKKYYPQCKITFLGRSYTQSIAMSSIYVDEFMNRDEWFKISEEQITPLLQERNFDTVIHLLPDKVTVKACWKAKIKKRVGGMNKILYLRYCNRFVAYSRKKSRLSEAQLNLKLLAAIGIKEIPARHEVAQYYGFSNIPALESNNRNLLDGSKFNLILHPLSNKNAKEWGLHNFSALVKLIDLNRFKIFVTGSEKEKEILAPWIGQHGNEITDLTGSLNTDQLIAFIAASNGLIASSTGPVHIAAAAGINTLGLYEDRWIKRGERWGPIGKKADFIECKNEDMNTISPEMVYEKMNAWTRRLTP